MKHTLYLSLGSNIEPREQYLNMAVKALSRIFTLLKVSKVYETAPVDDTGQENFLNICLVAETVIEEPLLIFGEIQRIENDLGRKRDAGRPKGPRTIDIDILFIDTLSYNDGTLTIPHARFTGRKFVIVPLLELLSEDSDMIRRYDLKGHLAACDEQEVRMYGELQFE